MDKLTKKQRGFVKDYLETDNATEAAERNYEVKNRNVANAIGAENLAKPSVKQAIESLANRIPDDKIIEKHLSLFEQKQVEYFTFPKKMNDVEIEDKVNRAGFEVITISEGEKGKYAFYSIPNANAIKSALDMSYKLKGAYSDEAQKTTNILMPVLVKFLEKKDDTGNDYRDTE